MPGGRDNRLRKILRATSLQGIAIGDIKQARAAGRTDEELKQARDFQRRAQFYLDFIEAENSMGFHAPQEAVRILGESINFSRLGQVFLRGAVAPAHTTAATATGFTRASMTR